MKTRIYPGAFGPLTQTMAVNLPPTPPGSDGWDRVLLTVRNHIGEAMFTVEVDMTDTDATDDTDDTDGTP